MAGFFSLKNSRTRLLICILFAFCVFGGIIFYQIKKTEFAPAPKSYENIIEKEAQDNKLYEMSSSELDVFLKELKERFPIKEERLEVLSLLRLGTPYELGCLGEGKGRDPDPIFRLDVTDCTVFVLTNIALLHAESAREAEALMASLNYYPPGEISYESRLHFTTYRNLVSPYFKDITREVGKEKTRKKTIVLNKKRDDGNRLIDIDFEEVIEVEYIPASFVSRDLFENLPLVVGIAFLKDGDEKIGLDVRHEGFLLSGEKLIHASSQKGKVVQEDFFEYFFNKNGPVFDGIILFKVTN